MFSIICACAIAARDRADNCLHRTIVLDRACAAVAIDVRDAALTREDRTDEDGAARGVVGGIVIEDGQVPGNHGIRVDGECVFSGVDAGASSSADRVGEGRHGRQDGGGHGSGRGVRRGAEAHDDPESHSLLFLTFLGCSIFRCFYCYMIIALLLYLRCVFFMYGPSFVSNSGRRESEPASSLFQVGVKFDFSSDLLHVLTYIILHTRTFWGGIPRAPPTQRTQK